jgi:hypothetical protein
MYYTIDIRFLFAYILIAYVIGGLLLFTKQSRHGTTSAHDDLNFFISPLYVPVLIAFGIANWIFPDKFKD